MDWPVRSSGLASGQACRMGGRGGALLLLMGGCQLGEHQYEGGGREGPGLESSSRGHLDLIVEGQGWYIASGFTRFCVAGTG